MRSITGRLIHTVALPRCRTSGMNVAGGKFFSEGGDFISEGFIFPPQIAQMQTEITNSDGNQYVTKCKDDVMRHFQFFRPLALSTFFPEVGYFTSLSDLCTSQS